jgi:hypothetical protein
MKISRKSIIIASSILILGGTSLIFYLTNRNSESIQGWMDSNWVYRRAIDVTGSGSTLLNEDVLIELDTASLISNGKLQADCDDLRFVDSDDSTSLDYWVEGGCNTANTQVWVQIPSLPAGGTTIYVYYGNESAVNAELSWSGNFIVLNSSSCPQGWTRESIYDNKFPYGSETYGTSFDGLHNHSQVSCTTGGQIGGTLRNGADDDSPNRSVFRTSHTHTNARVDINNAEVVPPYVNLSFCSNTDLTISSGSISLFNTNSSSLPSDFSYYSAIEGRYPRGNATAGTTGGSNTHTHTTTGGYNTGTASTFDSKDADNTSTPNVHYHTTINGITVAGNNNLPYYSITYGLASNDTQPTSNIIEMSTAIPPLGWNRFSNLDNKYPLGSSTAGSSSAGTTHTHSVTINTGNASATKSGVYFTSGTSFLSGGGHTHSCTTTTSTTQALAAYISTIFIQRKSTTTVTLDTEQSVNARPRVPSSPLCEGETNPTGLVDYTPEFSAIFSDLDTTDTGNYYQILVNTESDFTGTVMWDSTKTAFLTPVTNNTRCPDITYDGDTLLDGEKYYWRIKFWDNQIVEGEGSWSETQNFTMNSQPNAPTNILIQGATNPNKVTTTTPTISAIFTDSDETDTATYYEIKINTSSDFSGTQMWYTGKTSTTAVINHERSSNYTYAGTTLSLDGTKYYIRMRWWDNKDGQSEWSATNTFRMQGPPSVPTELRRISTNPTTPTFSAIYSDPNEDSATAYEIEINDAIGFDGTSLWDTGKTSTSVTNNTRSPEYSGFTMTNSKDTLYWRIRFWDSEDTVGSWSETLSFLDSYSSLQMEGIGMEGIKID